MDGHQKITIYSADTSNRSLFRHFREVLSELPEAHELGFRLFKRNVKAKYRQSLLGFFWALLPPLVTAALWIFLRSNNVMSMGETSVPYPVFVFVGTMLWQIFAESLNAPMTSISSNRSILVKINIPREGILLSGIYEVILNLLIKLLVLSVIFVSFDQNFTVSLLGVIPGILSIMICGFSIGLMMTPIGMLYTDIQRGLTILLPLAMYLTPVIYPAPESGFMGWLMKLNPMAPLLVETRNWFTSQPIQDLNLFLLYTGLFSILACISLMIFRISMPMIIERSGN